MEDLKPLLDSYTAGPIIIAGPCSAESRRQVMQTAAALAAGGVRIFRAGVWKPRTKPGGFEGAGEQALGWLAEVRRTTGMYIATEVATGRHAELALKAGIDILWLGARTSSSPFAVQEIADALSGSDAAVLVKNPVSPDLELWSGALERIYNRGIRRLAAVHRGFSLYETGIYRNDPHWSVPVMLRRRYPSLPVLCDPSHIGGRREAVAQLSQQALDLGFDGLIIESHISPGEALSDAAQQLTPDELLRLTSTLKVRGESRDDMPITEMRAEIDSLDDELLALLSRRMEVSGRIGEYKRRHGIKILQPERYDELLSSRSAHGLKLGLDVKFVREILRIIHEESIRRQM
ncbi:MAG: bifunctional 3-deoxy-7-phosphoheptulonate synthase/chorismate mutase type II [Alistipes sp.]|nr:bifunctional 3-deoxy-7-phosphoheptulonate synthase/chorismate mutase type II [Alistipes sp.]